MSGTGKRKREGGLDELLDRPWCYYCERDFDDLQVLQTHQREMHFRCDQCTRRLNTASGLTVHKQQVHKTSVSSIRNANPGRESPDIEIFGIVGIPEEELNAHRQAIIDGYYQRAAQFRALTGNPLPGTVKQDPNDKGKRAETAEEMKERLKAHMANKKARKAAEAAAAKKKAEEDEAAAAAAEANGHIAAPETRPADGMQVDSRTGTESNMEGTQLTPTLLQQQITPGHQDGTAFQPQPPTMANTRPNHTNGFQSAFPQYNPMTYNMYGSQIQQPVYRQAAVSSSPPPIPGLPSRPSFNAPNLSKQEMANFHHKQQPEQIPEPLPGMAPPSGRQTLPLPDIKVMRGDKAPEIHQAERLDDKHIMIWVHESKKLANVTFEEVKGIAFVHHGLHFDETAKPVATLVAI